MCSLEFAQLFEERIVIMICDERLAEHIVAPVVVLDDATQDLDHIGCGVMRLAFDERF